MDFIPTSFWGFLQSFTIGVVVSITVSTTRHYKNFIMNKYELRKIFNFGNQDDIIIVFSSQEPLTDEILRSAASEDVFAIYYIWHIIEELGYNNKISLLDSKKLSDADKQKNLICIGGSRVNIITSEILPLITNEKSQQPNFQEETSGWILRGTGMELAKLDWNPKLDKEAHDHAVIAKYTNPYQPNNKIFIIAGIHGIGTWGAAKFLREQYKEIFKRKANYDNFKKYGDFELFMICSYKNYNIYNETITHFNDVT